jgi:hypothetical protein
LIPMLKLTTANHRITNSEGRWVQELRHLSEESTATSTRSRQRIDGE